MKCCDAVWWGVVVLVLPLPVLLFVGVWVLVGLLFEICIVDASILRD